MNAKQKPATLGAGFVSKGAAKPADATRAPEEVVDTGILAPRATEPTQPAVENRSSAKLDTSSASSDQQLPAAKKQQVVNAVGTKSITVKVDGKTYDKLTTHGFNSGRKTNQAIFTEALGLYFEKYEIK